MPQQVRRGGHRDVDLQKARYRYQGDGDRDTAFFTAAGIAIAAGIVFLPLALATLLENSAGLPYTALCILFYGIEVMFGMCLLSFAMYAKLEAVLALEFTLPAPSLQPPSSCAVSSSLCPLIVCGRRAGATPD